MILADQGADVIKMEEPKEGDHTRSLSNRHRGFSAQFLNLNRNKRSITLDLKTGEGRAILKRLAATADVLVQNFRPGAVERLGIDEAAIRAVARRSSTFRSAASANAAPMPASRPTIPSSRRSRASRACREARMRRGRRLIRTVLPDKLTAVTAAQAIASALVGRLKSGKGQHVRLSKLDAVVAFLWASDMSAQTFIGQKVAEHTPPAALASSSDRSR